MPKSKVIVRINGSEYTLTGDEAEDYLFSIANFLDKKIKEILSSNPKHSNTSAAVLTALMISDELLKARKEIEFLKRSAYEPEEKVHSLLTELDELKLSYDALSNEYDNFRQTKDAEEQDINSLQEAYNELYQNYIAKNEEYEELLRENSYLKEQNVNLEKEIVEVKQNVRELKDELLENEIELTKLNKEIKNIKEPYGKKR